MSSHNFLQSPCHLPLSLGHRSQRCVNLAEALDGLVFGHGADFVGELGEDGPGRQQVHPQGLRMARVAADPASEVGHRLVQVAEPVVAFFELGSEPLYVRGHRAPQGLGAVLGGGVDVPGPNDLEARGDFLDHEYVFTRGDREVATVSKRWFSLGDTYGVETADGEDDVLILASAVVVDQACHRDDGSRH